MEEVTEEVKVLNSIYITRLTELMAKEDNEVKAPSLTREGIESKIREVSYTNLPSGKSIICEIILKNGYSVRGEASCVSKANFNQEKGNSIALENAVSKIWQLEGYLLQEKHPC